MTRPACTVTVGGLASSTSGFGAAVTSVVVERDMDVPADGLWLEAAPVSDASLGDDVSVDLDSGDGSGETVFTGTVVALRPAITGGSVWALGPAQALVDLRVAATFEDQSAGSIATDLVGRAGLSAGTVDDGPVLPRYSVDQRLSLWGHLKALADRLGFELYASRDGSIMFHALGAAAGLDGLGALPTPPGAGTRFRYGHELVEAAAFRQPVACGTVEVGGESPMSGQGDTTAHWLTVNDADYRGSAGDATPVRLALEPTARTKDIADRFAAGRLAVGGRRAHEVTVTVPGWPRVDLGDGVTVADVPEGAVNGEGYVRALRHHFGPRRGFVTRVTVAVAPPA
jgi:hypothetical protein